MEKIEHEGHQTSDREPDTKQMQKLNETIKARLKKIYERLGRFSYLEIVGAIAIAIIVLEQFFGISVSVTEKPLLRKILGQSTLPPRLSGVALPASQPGAVSQAVSADSKLLAQVLPSAGVELPVTWGDLGVQMIRAGVIDQQKFIALYSQRGGLSAEETKMLVSGGNGKIIITPDNSDVILNLLWAFGLGNKNAILDKGEMQDPKYGGAGKFASTGGWTLSVGAPMNHYSRHAFVTLTAEQQVMVDRVSRNIYRICCGNSTHFPDCNHGIAMLGLLELMAKNGVSEKDMYKYALSVNSYWFPDAYLTIASYFQKQGVSWNQVDPQIILSAKYSSGQGYQQLLSQTQPQQAPKSKGGCGV